MLKEYFSSFLPTVPFFLFFSLHANVAYTPIFSEVDVEINYQKCQFYYKGNVLDTGRLIILLNVLLNSIYTWSLEKINFLLFFEGRQEVLCGIKAWNSSLRYISLQNTPQHKKIEQAWGSQKEDFISRVLCKNPVNPIRVLKLKIRQVLIHIHNN